MKRLITREWFGIIALTIILIPQVAHTVYVFQANSQYSDPWFAWCYAVGVDLAILIFTVKGWKKTALIYLLGTIAHNLVYQFYPESIYGAILVGIVLSGTIFSFSHLFYATKSENTKDQGKSISELFDYLQVQNIDYELKPHTCPECHKSFATAKQLNGHISGHKQTRTWHEENYGDWESENSMRENLLQQILTRKNGVEVH